MANPLFLGIEIGGTKLQMALGRADGNLCAQLAHKVDASVGAAHLRQRLVDSVATFLSVHDQASPAAVGIGFGGPVDTKSGLTITSHQVNGWDDFALVEWARDALGIERVALGNDSDCAAIAEARHGAGIGYSPMLYVNSGSGVGGGLVIDGQLYRGSQIGAVEIGHLWLAPVDTELAQTLEQTASGWAIAANARRAIEDMADRLSGAQSSPLLEIARELGAIDGQSVAKAALAGDPVAGRILERARHGMVEALAHAVTLLAPRRVVLGGGVAEMDPSLWVGPIGESLQSRVFPGFRGQFDVVKAALGQTVVLHGAIAIAAESIARF